MLNTLYQMLVSDLVQFDLRSCHPPLRVVSDHCLVLGIPVDELQSIGPTHKININAVNALQEVWSIVHIFVSPSCCLSLSTVVLSIGMGPMPAIVHYDVQNSSCSSSSSSRSTPITQKQSNIKT